MLLIGILVVIVSVIGGFTIAGGHLGVMFQPAEFIVILGAVIGSVLIASPISVIKKIINSVMAAIKPNHITKQDYLETLKSFSDLFLAAQRDGLLSIESHIENPKESKILTTNKKFIEDDFTVDFFCDTMKVLLTGSIPPHELETLIETEIETYELENNPIASQVAIVGDALPGLGIVAAVLGIIITMGSIDDGAAAVGRHVAAALVGTFLGVLLSYGIVSPLASKIHHDIDNKIRYLETIKAAIVAYAKGNPPMIAVEIARRTIFSDGRPTFEELENYLRGKNK
ncbi:MAG: flagellar motor stator protein MotA [Melioribacteraceae bacterium]|nr:flagellar motor stator protein MotA [Melioribacteraceae bacterium]